MSTLSQFNNISIDEKSWSQASLPVRFGRLGLRFAVDVSLLAFISSIYVTSSLVSDLTSLVYGLLATTEFAEARMLKDELSGGTECPAAE